MKTRQKELQQERGGGWALALQVYWWAGVWGAVVLLGVMFGGRKALAAPPTWPSAREVWVQDFEGGGIGEFWEDHGEGHVSVSSEAALGGSGGGLSVDVSGEGQFYLQRYNLDEWPHLEFPRDTYFEFRFDPNGVSIPEGEAVSLIRLRDGDWNVLAGVRLQESPGGGSYELLLELPDGSFDGVALEIDDEPQVLTLGCRPDDWVGLWVDGVGERVVDGVEHGVSFVQVLLVGKTEGTWSGETPSGRVFFDDITLLYATYHELWVDPETGDDSAEGNSPDAPLKSVGAAALLVGPGTVVHLAPGDYREALVVPVDGTQADPIRFVADGGRRTARLLGSRGAAEVSWTRLTDPNEIDLPAGVDLATATIWKADLSAWGLEEAPGFVVVREGAQGGGGAEDPETVQRLPRAREPDWHVETPWKHHEFWWAAEGGDSETSCDPVADPECDEPNRSQDTLTDTSADTAPVGIEPGSLADLGDVTGAVMYVKGTRTGHYTYQRRVSQTLEPGRVRLEALPDTYWDGCWFDHDPSMPNLGWNSKYFVEGLAKFLDTPGEWHYEVATSTLYIWTEDGRSPDELGVEISVRDTGVDLSHRSYVELVDLAVWFFQEEAVRITGSGSEDDRLYGLTLAGLDLGWSKRGLHMAHGPENGTAPGSQTRGFTLRDSVVHDMDSLAIYFWTGSGESFARPGITDVRIVHNEFARIGFRDNEQGSVGMSFQHADHLLFAHNHVHHIAHNGVIFSKAQTRSSPGYDVPRDRILTGDVLVRDNLFEHCVQNATDAGGLKFWGANADRSHTFRDVLVFRNVSRNNVGWAWVSQERQNWTYHGKGGMGYYIDFAGGVHFFRNIAYANGLAGFMASGSWVDSGAVLVNNTVVDSPKGYTMGVRDPFSDENQGLVIANSLFVHSQQFALSVGDPHVLQGDVVVDYNLYHLNGYEPWPQHTPGILAGRVEDSGYEELPTLEEVRARLGLETHGAQGDPRLAGYDPEVTDGSWQDFRLTQDSSLALDTGAPLPDSLVDLLARFHIDDGMKGAALDMGALELDPSDPDKPHTLDVGPTDGSGEIQTPWGDDYPDPDPDPDPQGGGGGGCGCRWGGGHGSLPVPLFWMLGILGLFWAAARRRSAEGTAKGRGRRKRFWTLTLSLAMAMATAMGMALVGLGGGCVQDRELAQVVSVCGNGRCEEGEDPLECVDDCPFGECGNNYCEWGEDRDSCMQDCAWVLCGDGICGGSETYYSCPEDCELNTCGNGTCEGVEDESCPADCFPARCGNGVCETLETQQGCPNDCPLAAKLDLLFVVDNSGSMQPHQLHLQAAVAELLAELLASWGVPDLHVGVVTTDLGTGAYTEIRYCESVGGDRGRLGVATGEALGEGCLGGSQRYLVDSLPQGCEVTREAVVCVAHDCTQGDCDAAGGPGEALTLMEDDRGCPRCVNYTATRQEAVECLTQVGTEGCGFEQHLEAMKLALDTEATPENEGFLRQGSLLAVVFLADEDDCSASRPDVLFNPSSEEDHIDSTLGFLHSFRCFEFGVVCDINDRTITGPRQECRPREDDGALLHPMSRYIAFLAGLRQPGRVVMMALAGPVPETLTVKLDDQNRPELENSCVASGNEGAAPAVRLEALASYFNATQDLDSWAFTSVCQDSYEASLSSFGTKLRDKLSPPDSD